MTVKELKEKLSLLNDDAEIILDCHDIHGARINSNFDIQTNDEDDNSPVYFEFSAYERKIQEEKIFNSIKALEVKPNDTVVVSMIPNQLSLRETAKIFEYVKKAFPDNKVNIVIGLDVTIEKGE